MESMMGQCLVKQLTMLRLAAAVQLYMQQWVATQLTAEQPSLQLVLCWCAVVLGVVRPLGVTQQATVLRAVLWALVQFSTLLSATELDITMQCTAAQHATVPRVIELLVTMQL
jgi:hypothetical protein